MRQLLLLIFCCPLWAAPIKVCHVDVPARPWILADGGGLAVGMAHKAAEQLGIELQIAGMPWKRCLALLERGEFDAALASSWLPERGVYALFPLDKDGQPNTKLRLFTDHYAVYRHYTDQHTKVVDGKISSNKNKPVIAIPLGYSIGNLLKTQNVQLDESDKDHAQILRKVAMQLVDGAALLADDADALLASRPDLAAQVVRVDPPLQVKPYYLVFNKTYAANRMELVQKLWQTLAQIRDSSEFRQQCALQGVTP